jgi:thioesterase domain-containing protein
MTRAALKQFLHDRIPLTRAMEIDVVDVCENRVTLGAPLVPNVNHRQTVFGGSASSLAILAAWSLVYVRLKSAHPGLRIVIQRNATTYERPIIGDFTATSGVSDPEAWERFQNTLRRRGRARIHVTAVLQCCGERVGALDAAFVAERLPATLTTED